MMPSSDQVNTLVVDVDGVLTDGAIHVHENGTQSVRFCVKDGLGLVRWRESGRTLVAITGRDRPEVKARLASLGFHAVRAGVKDKAETLREVANTLDLSCASMIAVGDDLPDLDMFALAGFSACPADAVPAVRERAGTILKAPGGHGAIRELVDRILGPGVPAP
ncbi:MAG: HAD hydrolase family protein [Phycisphaerales bacterium]|nr:HAD hydrolase family protein [Phycisphaerales bacterium]MEC8354525.1 HAD hydrolase family protein [Planctomycetota bacterium]